MMPGCAELWSTEVETIITLMCFASGYLVLRFLQMSIPGELQRRSESARSQKVGQDLGRPSEDDRNDIARQLAARRKEAAVVLPSTCEKTRTTQKCDRQ